MYIFTYIYIYIIFTHTYIYTVCLCVYIYSMYIYIYIRMYFALEPILKRFVGLKLGSGVSNNSSWSNGFSLHFADLLVIFNINPTHKSAGGLDMCWPASRDLQSRVYYKKESHPHPNGCPACAVASWSGRGDPGFSTRQLSRFVSHFVSRDTCADLLANWKIFWV